MMVFELLKAQSKAKPKALKLLVLFVIGVRDIGNYMYGEEANGVTNLIIEIS